MDRKGESGGEEGAEGGLRIEGAPTGVADIGIWGKVEGRVPMHIQWKARP
jgi:hypothetical protein